MKNLTRALTYFPAAAVSGFLLCMGCFSTAFSQVSDPVSPIPDYVRQAAEARAKNNPSFNDLMNKAGLGGTRSRAGGRRGMSADDRKRIKALMTPEPADIEKYREFLKEDDTGIFRLYPDFDCEAKGVVNVAGNCANQVHRGSRYNFRDSDYFSDLRYNNGKLSGSGFFSHEMLTELGDVPLENLDLNSPGVEFLNAYSPATDFPAANRQFREIVSGIKAGNLNFSRSVTPLVGLTYAMRIVAFDNKNSIQNRLFRRTREPLLWTFRTVQADKRHDVIVAFRIVRMEADGNITIVWKQLSRKKAPSIKFDDREPLQTFK